MGRNLGIERPAFSKYKLLNIDELGVHVTGLTLFFFFFFNILARRSFPSHFSVVPLPLGKFLI